MRDEFAEQGDENYSPFADYHNWELGEWLMKNVGQTAIDEYLRLHVVSA
jgi:hypothetical protein